MNTLWNSIIGLAFAGVALVLTFLMFYLWKFPYDKTTHRVPLLATWCRYTGCSAMPTWQCILY